MGRRGGGEESGSGEENLKEQGTGGGQRWRQGKRDLDCLQLSSLLFMSALISCSSSYNGFLSPHCSMDSETRDVCEGGGVLELSIK